MHLIVLSSLIWAVISGVPDFKLSIRWDLYQGKRIDGFPIDESAVETTDCFSQTTNKWSEWAHYPEGYVAFFGLDKGQKLISYSMRVLTVEIIQLQCSNSMVLDGTDTDFRVCIQLGSANEDGETSCSEWSSNGHAGGLGPAAGTSDGAAMSKARIMIQTRTIEDATRINDFQIGMTTFSNTYSIAPVRPEDCTGFSVEGSETTKSKGFEVYKALQHEHGLGVPLLYRVMMYLEIKNDDDYRCSVKEGVNPKEIKFCNGQRNDRTKMMCGLPRMEVKCEWRRCDSLGQCEVDDALTENVNKVKSVCGKRTSSGNCNNFVSKKDKAKLCKWVPNTGGQASESYLFDEDYNADIDWEWFDENVEIETDYADEHEKHYVFVRYELAAIKNGLTAVEADKIISNSVVVLSSTFSAVCIVVCMYALLQCIANSDVKGKKESESYSEYMQTI